MYLSPENLYAATMPLLLLLTLMVLGCRPSAGPATAPPADRSPTLATSTISAEPAPPPTPTAPERAPEANVSGLASSEASAPPAPSGAPSANEAPLITLLPGATPTAAAPSQSASELREIIASNRPALRRVCWDPFEKKKPSTPQNIKVTVLVDINGRGQVTSATATAPDAPELGTCIEQRMKGLSFPSGRSPAKVSFPLLFVAS